MKEAYAAAKKYLAELDPTMADDDPGLYALQEAAFIAGWEAALKSKGNDNANQSLLEDS